MNDKTLILDIKRDETLINAYEANVNVAVFSDGHKIMNYQPHRVSLSEINRISHEILASINTIHFEQNSEEQKRLLEQNGKLLCDEILPINGKKALMDSDASYLIVSINDHLVHVPFELIFLKDQFLCQKYAIGREVHTRQDVKFNQRETKAPLSMWLINNPTGDLSHAASEGKAIRSILKKYKDMVIGPIHMEPKVSKEQIKSRICDYDIVHFAGHGHFDSKSPGRSGWKCRDDIFSANDIHKLTCNAPMPSIVFSNACQSGRTNAWENQTSVYGIANAFKLAGVQHYIGTFSNIPDTTSHTFAKTFYNQLFSGVPLGMAMQKARKQLIETQGDLCWASYHLYGDPRTKYFTQKDAPPDDVLVAPVQERSGQPENVESVVKEKIDRSEPTFENLQNSETNSISKRSDPENKTIKSKLNIYKNYAFIAIFILFFTSIFSWHWFKCNKPKADIDNWTSTTKTIAILFDEKDNVFTDNIQKSICNAFEKALCSISRFKVLERRHIDIIKVELDLWMSKYSSVKDSYVPEVLPCDIIIFVDFTPMIEKNEITIKLIQPSNTMQPKIIISNLEAENLYGPYDSLCNKLIETLFLSNPLQGRIINVNNQVTLNIGDNVGVLPDQLFEITSGNALLKVVAVEKNKSFADIETQGSGIQIDAQVRWKNSYLNLKSPVE